MKLRAKYLLLLVSCVAVGIIVSVVVYFKIQAQQNTALETLRIEMETSVKEELKWLTESTVQQLTREIQESESDASTTDVIWKVVKDVRFFDDKSGYFFVYDLDGTTIALPPAPDKHGENRINLVDSNGTYFVKELANRAKAGGGYTIYHYPKPGSKTPFPKLAYSADIPGTTYFIGTGVYIDHIDAKIATTAKQLNKSKHATMLSFVIGGILLLIIITIAVIITISMLKALAEAGAFMQEISKGTGNLSVRMKTKGNDEISELGAKFNEFVSKLRSVIGELKENVIDVDQASTELNSTSDNLETISKQLESSVNESSSGSEKVSNSINNFSSTVESVANDVAGVASAVEELNATVQEVAKNCADESTKTSEASQKSTTLKTTVDGLKSASDEINQVIEIIDSIAKQTNLLALNATIEAASAGEAGKGFAVVANEVKELARQSSEATDRIRNQVEQIQQSSNATITGIEEIGNTITEVDHIANSIAVTVEEQSSTTNEISSLTHRVAESLRSLADEIGEISGSAAQVTADVKQTGDLTQQTSSSASETNSSAQRLNQISHKIREITEQFKI